MHKTQLMGVLNITPDSFYEGSRVQHTDAAVSRGIHLQEQGADILDIGGESTRPGAASISETEELARVIPVITALKGQLSIPISIDTVKPAVARAAIKAGATLLNDISGFRDPAMVAVAVEYGVDICVMHMDGTPETMQIAPHYPTGISSFLMDWFASRLRELNKAGVQNERIILDPGIGFGKTVADNLEIIHNIPKFRTLGCRVLIGASRKSFLSRILNKPPTELLAATLAIDSLAIAAGADIIRAHDVAEHRDIIDVITAYESYQSVN